MVVGRDLGWAGEYGALLKSTGQRTIEKPEMARFVLRNKLMMTGSHCSSLPGGGSSELHKVSTSQGVSDLRAGLQDRPGNLGWLERDGTPEHKLCPLLPIFGV